MICNALIDFLVVNSNARGYCIQAFHLMGVSKCSANTTDDVLYEEIQ